MAKGKYDKWLEPDGLLLLEAWARDGLIDEQIAHNMGVSIRTLSNYKEKYLPILHALKRGKEVADIEVENALRKRALGFEYTEVKLKYEYDDLVERTETVKIVPPDVGAAAFWLKNRRPDKWSDKKEESATGGVTIVNNIPRSNPPD